MAETKLEKRTFKWGDSEYLLDDLLKLHAQQENNYYNFAKQRGQYTDEALEGLRTAIANRMTAVKSGKVFDADGIMEGDAVDNISFQANTNKRGKKGVTVNQDNTEWAKYYLNQLVSNLKPYEKSKASGSWDISKHGIGAYLTGQGLNAQDVFEKYDVRDENNPDAPRTNVKRRELLKQHLTGYKNWLASKGFDFSANDNDWDDNFGTDFDKFVTDYDNLDNNALTAALRKFGAGDAYTTAFTSTNWNLADSGKTSEEKEAAEKERKAKEEQDKWESHIRGEYNTYQNLEDNNYGGTFFRTGGDGKFEMSDDEFEKWSLTHTDDRDAYLQQLLQNYYINPFDEKVAAEYLPLAHRYGNIKEVNIDGKTYYYDPGTIDRAKNRLVIFDKTTGETKHTFIGDIEEEKNALKRKFRIDNGYEKVASKYFQEGGVISMQMGGNFNLAQAVQWDLDERNRQRAEANGNSEEVQRARDRIVSNGDDSFTSEDKMIKDQNTGFTGAEIARLGTIAADITSMFLDPVTGTAIGLGSSLVNFGADIADDGFQWSDVGNLGVNVGFDLLGAIPIFGDALGTGSKITKQVIKWAPRIMTGLAAYQGVANFDGMMESWGKLTSGDKEQKLTVQDWRNIAQSIGLVTGATRAIKNKVAQNQMKAKAKVDDVVGVNVRDKNGNLQQILVDGDTAKNIRAAKGVKSEIEAELGKLESFKDKFGENGTLEVATQSGKWQKPWEKVTNADGSTSRQLRGLRGEGRAQVSDVYDFSRVPGGYGESVGYKIPVVSDYLNNKHMLFTDWLNKKINPTTADYKGAITSADIDAKVKAHLDEINAEIEKIKESMDARGKSRKRIDDQLIPERDRLVELQRKLNGAPDEATLTTSKSQIEQDLVTNDLNIATKQNELKKAEKDLQKLLNKRRVAKKNQKAHKAATQSARVRVQGQKNALSGLENRKIQLTDDLNTVNSQLQAHGELPIVQKNVNRLQGIRGNLSSGNHTHAYNRLLQLLSDLQTNHSNIDGRTIDWGDINTVLSNAGVLNAFKQGGTINRNKINKFLNYAKG